MQASSVCSQTLIPGGSPALPTRVVYGEGTVVGNPANHLRPLWNQYREAWCLTDALVFLRTQRICTNLRNVIW